MDSGDGVGEDPPIYRGRLESRRTLDREEAGKGPACGGIGGRWVREDSDREEAGKGPARNGNRGRWVGEDLVYWGRRVRAEDSP